MIRRATEADMPRISEIRLAVRENILRDPAKITRADVLWFIENPGIFLWEEDGVIAGFSAADPRNGSIWALFMDARYEGRGIARALFARAVAVLDEAHAPRPWLHTTPGTRAERFYRAAGWIVTGMQGDQVVFERPV